MNGFGPSARIDSTKLLIISGIILIIAGIVIWIGSNKFGWFGNLPGDIKVEKKELHELIWKFRQSYHPDVNLISGVSDLLCELSLKYILATASYAQSYYTYRELEKSGIAQYFSHFIFSSDIGYRKTDQEFYKICLKKTNNAPEECLMVGDNYLQDVVTPKKVGLKAVLIRNPLTDRQNIIGDVKPDGIIRLEDIKTLPLIIQSIK